MQAIAVLRFLAVIGGFLTLSPFSLAIAASQIRESNTGLCVYDDKSYSEGAYLCIERSLILSCELAEGRLVWKIVKERDAGGFCQKRGATASNYHPPPERRPVFHRTSPDTPAATKCFHFNSKTYCE
jgi:hypothetical protein